MILKYKGNGRGVSFVTGNYYEARKVYDEMGTAYAIFDEGDDWYRYGTRFVAENFEVIAEDEQEFKQTV